jgi:tetratricopeptide (TPR) repeat protein
MKVKPALLILGILIATCLPRAWAIDGLVFSGCSSCSAGCPSQCPRSSNPNRQGNNGPGNSAGTETKSFPSDAELEKLSNAILNREYALFKKIKSHPWTEATAQEWLAFYQQDGQWSVAYYNYALTEMRLGSFDKAENAFAWLMTNCRNHIIPSPPDDLSICTDARHYAIEIKENAGIDAYNRGDYATAESLFTQEAALVMPKDRGYIDGWTEGGYMYPYPWYNMSLAETMLQKWDAAFASANEAASRTYQQNDPFRPQAMNRWYTTWEDVRFARAVTAIRSPETMDRNAVLSDLEDAIRFDPVTDRPSYNARAMLAKMLHTTGDDALAEREADIARLQNPGEDANTSMAQLVLDTIHSYDLMTDCEKVREIERSDGLEVKCNLDGSAVVQQEVDHLMIHSSEIRHWPNKCSTLVKDASNPDDGRLLNCQ